VTPAEWIASACAVIALLVSVAGYFRSTSDRRIDERIDLKLAPDIAVMKNQLESISANLTQQSTQAAAVVRAAVETTAAAIRDAADSIVEARTHVA
jgi:hypothetical protein